MSALRNTSFYLQLQHSRQFTLSTCLCRRKPKPERDMSKRNLQGEALQERLRRREEDIERQKPYKNALSAVINRFKLEIEEIERQKHDIQGELVKREIAEREEAARNRTLIAKSNEDMRKQREIQRLIDDDEQERKREEAISLKQQQRENIRQRNTEIVLRLIEESKDFVSVENLDEKIAECLENEINFNYAVTPFGEKIHSTKPPGNMDGWMAPSPSAYIMGGFKPGGSDWNFIFKNKETGFEQKEKQRENSS